MSLQLNQDLSLPISRIFDGNVDISRQKEIKLLCGASDCVYQNYNCVAPNNSQLVFQAQLPGRTTLLDRQVYVDLQWSVTLTGTFTLNTNGSAYGPRMMPLANACNNVSVDLQGSRQSYDPSRCLTPMSWLCNTEFNRRSFRSPGCSMPDQYQSYQTATGPRNPFSLYGANELEETRYIGNYLRSYTNNVGTTTVYPDGVPGAGAFSGQALGNIATTTTLTLNFETIEQLCCPPFNCGYLTEPALCGIQNLTVTYNIANINRLMSGIPTLTAGAITKIGYNITGAILRTRLYNMPVTYRMPSSVCWSIYDIVRYTQSMTGGTPTANTGLLPGASSTLTSQTIAWKGNPKLILIWVEIAQGSIYNTSLISAGVNYANGGEQFANVFGGISMVSITYDNKIVLSTISPDQMYDLSVRRGNVMTYTQWRSQVGSLLAFCPAEDFSLKDGDAAQVYGDHQFQVTVNFYRPVSNNPDIIPGGPIPSPAVAYPYELNVLALMEGELWVDMKDGVFKTSYNNIPLSVSLTSPIEYGAYLKYKNLQHLTGFGFWDTLKGIVHTVSGLAAPILGALSAVPGTPGIIGSIGAPIASAIKGVTGGKNAYIRKRVH